MDVTKSMKVQYAFDFSRYDRRPIESAAFDSIVKTVYH